MIPGDLDMVPVRTWKVDHHRNLRTKACTALESTGSVSRMAMVTMAQ